MTDNHRRDHLFTPKWLQAVLQTWLIFDVDVRRPVDQAEVDVTITYRDPDSPDRLHPLKVLTAAWLGFHPRRPAARRARRRATTT